MANLVTIAHFPSTASAEIARNVLASAGISSVTNSALGLNAYYGDWMQGVELQVDEIDAERAVYLLEAQEKLGEGEDVEGGSVERTSDKEMHLDDVEENKEKPLPPMEFTSVGQQASGEVDDNPYVSPTGVSLRTTEQDELEDNEEDADDEELEDEQVDVEDDARRMFRGAVVSAFLPFIAPAITWQLIGRLDQYQQLSSRGKSRVVWAWVISLPITLFIVGWILLYSAAYLFGF